MLKEYRKFKGNCISEKNEITYGKYKIDIEEIDESLYTCLEKCKENKDCHSVSLYPGSECILRKWGEDLTPMPNWLGWYCYIKPNRQLDFLDQANERDQLL